MLAIAGAILIALAVVLLVFAALATRGMGEKVMGRVAGRLTTGTMLYIVGGIVAGVVGTAMVALGS